MQEDWFEGTIKGKRIFDAISEVVKGNHRPILSVELCDRAAEVLGPPFSLGAWGRWSSKVRLSLSQSLLCRLRRSSHRSISERKARLSALRFIKALSKSQVLRSG
jgi:hypothetical protein